jgi:glycosyltransferase involved in cell wall biosynthesis
MFISTIIPTVGRTTLDIAIKSVLDQDVQGVTNEIIVVNDSGKPLAHADWMDCDQVRMIDTNHNERSVARNTGAAIAKGEYLHFLDDDDWILPNVFQRFYLLAEATQAAFLYGGARLAENEKTALYDIHMKHAGNCFAQLMAGEWIPTGSYLIKRETFFETGGFTPMMSIYEDFDFTRRAALEVDFAFIDEPVLCILRGSDWTSTTKEQRYLQLIRKISLNAREKILSHPAAFRRSLQSAKTNYWRGHVLRTYASSLIWNYRNRAFSLVFARMLQTVGVAIASGSHLLHSSYWKGLMEPHSSTIVKLAPIENR